MKASFRIQLVSDEGGLIDQLILHIKFVDIDICTAPPSRIKNVSVSFVSIISLFPMKIFLENIEPLNE